MSSVVERWRLLAASVIMLGTPMLAARGRAEGAWPNRPVTVIVPWAAGGSTDLGRPFVVDNRTGASGTVGMASAARAKADGHTVVIAPNSTYAIAPNLDQLPYETVQTFTGVGLLAAMPTVMAVRRDSAAHDAAGYVALVQRSGGREAWANAGAGSFVPGTSG